MIQRLKHSYSMQVENVEMNLFVFVQMKYEHILILQ